jgi:CubicO group peptidase (beta-lactamase class C family)
MRTKNYFSIVFTALIFIVLGSSCTIVRIVAHFNPSVSDYKIFPCDTIPAAQNKSLAFTKTESSVLPDFKTWIPAHFRNGTDSLKDFLDQSKTTSFLVMRNDTLLYEYYGNKHEKEDPQIIFSITKGITAMLTAIAVQDSLLNPEQHVSDFIPEYAFDARKDIKIKHLLNMVSGIDFSDRGNLARLAILYYHNNQSSFIADYEKMSHRPGTFFSYQSIATQILGNCLEKATKMKLKDYLQLKLWQPLGMEYDALYTKDSKKYSNNRAFGGLAIRSSDLLRIGKLLLNHGKWEGKQIIPADFTEKLMNREVRDDSWWGYCNSFWRDGGIDTHFLEDKDFFAAGFGGQFLYVNPTYNVVIVRQGIKETFRWPKVFPRLAMVLGGKDNDVVDICKDYSEQFEGVYESSNGEKYEVVYKGLSAKTGERQWVIFKDINQTLRTRKLFVAGHFDGRSIGIYRLFYISRAIFDVENNSVKGMYYDNQRAVDMRYFVKKSNLSLSQRKEMLARVRRSNDRKVKIVK